jgi:hypothetical protein
MKIEVVSGSVGTGLGIVGTGLAYAMPEAKWIGWPLIVLGMLILVFDIRFERGQIVAGRSRLYQVGPWMLIVLGPLLGFLWLYVQTDRPSPVAKLAELGWSVQPEPEIIQFSISSKPLPSMQDSAKYFRQLDKPFRLSLQSVPSLDGLRYLADVPGCVKIEIGAGKFTDISDLGGFKYLTNLIISQTPIDSVGTVDVSPLGSLLNLTGLHLGSTRVKFIEALAPLHKLTSLYLRDTLIDDISVVAGFSFLREIDVTGTRVTDLSPLKGVVTLNELGVSRSQIPALTSLAASRLKTLRIIEQTDVDLSPVGALTRLEDLFVWGVPHFDFQFLRGLSNLRSAHLAGIGFTSLSAVSHSDVVGDLVDLESLVIGQMNLGDVSFVSRLKKLKQLNLNQVPISSIASLRSAQQLSKIALVDMPLVDISPLLDLPRLSELTIVRTPARSDVLTLLEKRGVAIRK